MPSDVRVEAGIFFDTLHRQVAIEELESSDFNSGTYLPTRGAIWVSLQLGGFFCEMNESAG